MQALVELPQLLTDANDDSTFGIIAGLFLAFNHTDVDNDSSCSTVKKKHNQTKQCNIFGSILTHSRGVQTLRVGAVLELAQSSNAAHGASGWQPDLSPRALMMNLSCATLSEPPPLLPSPRRQANNIRVNGKS